MQRLRALLLAGASLPALVLPAAGTQAAVIDFEGVAPPGGLLQPAVPHVEDGFEVFLIEGSALNTSIISASNPDPTFNTNGSDVFAWCGDCSSAPLEIALVAQGSVPFSLTGFAATDQIVTDEPQPPADLVVTAFPLGGTPFSLTFDLSAAWQTYTLPASFVGLEGVIFSASVLPARSLAIDDIEVTPIPLPAALPLLASALLGLAAAVTRRRTGRAG